ncbi:DUF3887 domain-containing protein [Spirosoma taeanense]|uniref:DUF3887 domain-containing protein n=1 Tax=Spirosoma taeanense TaxID=2735870 RepID=A0A6M5YEN8_9BACT|nr:DUF3887 domain-containing protein [Spirosoma taeanense]QJW91781.1 DUF3887 domain-containing protein [Spirosoma taeanense]
MKRLAFLICFGLVSFAVSAQTPAASPEATKLDSLARLSQQFLNNNQPDSLYALMGPAFKQQISPEKLREVMSQIAGQLGKWVSMESRSVKDGIARYKATFALAPLDFYISQDKQGKIETFLFKPLE